MSAPRTKRPFAGASSDPSQRQITSFFTTRPGAAPPSGPSPNPPQSLPSEVQSNLLSVGMRVRKSVPEGYKTGSYANSKVWGDATPAVVRTTPIATPNSTRKHPAAAAAAAAAQRELLPFCGIHKTGGLASQPAPAYYEDVPGLDDMPGLSSSQESVESVESTASDDRSRKRIFDEDDNDNSDEPMHMGHDRAAWLRADVSPRSLSPSNWANARPLAIPRKSRRGKAVTDRADLAVDDFEDADFLVTSDTDMSNA